MENRQLVSELNTLLQADRFHDYAPNGLQVEGRSEITRIVTGVTASLALLKEAENLGADAVLVHHGWFWKGESPCLTGIRRTRAQFILSSGMNLIAYHLPLDAHPELGNNAMIARVLGITPQRQWGEMDLGWIGTLPETITAREFAAAAGSAFGRTPAAVGDLDKPVRTVAWCSGAAQNMIEEAVNEGADIYLSGEISEQNFHFAQESGTPYLACGHHATERFGIQALGSWISDRFGLEVINVDIENPV